MAALLFYKDIASLNRETHKTLKFQSTSNYIFSKNVNSVPLTGIEFFEASRDMPVLFSKDSAGNFFPLAMLSLLDSTHFFVNSTGLG